MHIFLYFSGLEPVPVNCNYMKCAGDDSTPEKFVMNQGHIKLFVKNILQWKSIQKANIFKNNYRKFVTRSYVPITKINCASRPYNFSSNFQHEIVNTAYF